MKYSSQNLAKKLLKSAEAEPKKINELVGQFIIFCREKNLGYLLPNVLKYLEEEITEKREKETLVIKSKNDLSLNIIEKIKIFVRFDEKEGKIKLIKDNNILGGFIARYRDKIFDASVNNNLRLLKNKLINE